jgi:hypothetical protein
MTMREVADADGCVWAIFDVRPSAHRSVLPQVQAGYTQGWLCLQCADARRRLAPIPEGWEKGTEADLLDLLARATPAGKPIS